MRSTRLTHRRAKTLRATLTPPEAMLWIRLRPRRPGFPAFRRQHPYGPYILDFYCAKARLAIEIDGQSHAMGDAPVRDLRRAAYLVASGVRIMRYTALEVMGDPNGVADAIVDAAVALAAE